MAVMISRFTKAFIFIVLGLLLFSSLTVLHPPSHAYFDPSTGYLFGDGGVEQSLPRIQNPLPGSNADSQRDWANIGNSPQHAKPVLDSNIPPVHEVDNHAAGVEVAVAEETVHGGVIMGKLGNATAKAALGRATWKLLHTMTLRYPEHPTEDERAALSSYIHLTSRLYPCGECAAEFQKLLQQFPPQTSSRRSASLWLCHVHNQVNERLGHPIFDCAHLDDEYDCGCGDDPAVATATDTSETSSSSGSSDNNENEKTIIQVGDPMPGIGGLSEKKVALTDMQVGGTGKEVVIPVEGARDVDTGAEMIRGGR